MKNNIAILLLREKIYKELDLYKQDLVIRKKIVASFIEFFLLKMIKKIVIEEDAFYEDIKTDSYEDLAQLYVSLYGKQEYLDFYKDCLNQYKKGLYQKN